jgi:hypothetical protein
METGMRGGFSSIMIGLVAWSLSLAIGGVRPASAQFEDIPRLGLSASANSVVDSISVAPGAPFDLYMIAIGPEGNEPLSFGVSSIQWVIYSGCCGVYLEILGVDYNPLLEHVGTPLDGVVSTATDCLFTDVLCLATIRLRILEPTQGIAMLPAGAAGPGYDCDGGSRLFFDILFNAHLDGSIISGVPDELPPAERPLADASWGALKALFRP